MTRYPKFEKAIKDNIVNPSMMRTEQPGYGIVISYDPTHNTASVLAARPGTDMPGEIYNNVPCPVTPGVQGVAPEIGRPCWLAFRIPNSPTPYITHFFSFSYETKDQRGQDMVNNKIPRFMMDL